MPTGVYPRASLEERFWSKVDRSAGPEGCWLWIGACDHNGYGRFRTGGRIDYAHRVAYRLTTGSVSLELDHRRTCPKNCVNLGHLRPATRKQNMENRFGAQQNNGSSGVREVYWSK